MLLDSQLWKQPSDSSDRLRSHGSRLSRSHHNAKSRKYRFRRWAITTVCVFLVVALFMSYTVVFSRIASRLHQSDAGGRVHIVHTPETKAVQRLHNWLNEVLGDKVSGMPIKLYAEALMRAGVTDREQLLSLTEEELKEIGFLTEHASMFSTAFVSLRVIQDSPPGRERVAEKAPSALKRGGHWGTGTHIAVEMKDRIWFLKEKVGFDVTVRTPPGEKLLAIGDLRVSVRGPDGPMQIVRSVVNPVQSGSDVLQRITVTYTPSIAGAYFLFIRVDHVTDIHFTPESWITRVQKVFNRKLVSPEHVQAVEKLMRDIRRLQYPPDCNKARLYFYPLEIEMDYGVGANAEYMVSSFGRALATNRTFVIPTKRHERTAFYWAEKLCPSQSWFCYFAATSTCTEEAIDRRVMVDDDDSTRSLRARVVRGEPCPRALAMASFRKLGELYCPYSLLMGPSMTNHPMNLCTDGLQYTQACLVCQTWVAAFLTEWVFRPLPWLLDNFDAARRGMGAHWKHPLVTMHIRKTDKLKGKLKEARDPLKTYSLERYFSALDSIADSWPDQHGAKRAFVATDSDIVVKDLQKRWSKGRELIFNSTQKRYAKGTILLLRECKDKYGRRATNCVNQNEEGTNALRDIWMLANGDGFVGTRSSFFGRVAFLLMYASGRLQDYKFLDHDPWSHDYSGKFGFPQERSLCF